MANDNMPFVAIIGGFWDIDDPALVTDAKDAAREIGEALAKAGMGLVVYYSHQNSLEPYVVSGYASAHSGGTGTGSIQVRYADSQRGKVRFPEEVDQPELFEHKIYASRDWEAPFYRSLVNAEGVDAVLLMAGSLSTFIAGQIAVARPIPVLAIHQFGGSAGKIWTELSIRSEDYPDSSTLDAENLAAWLKGRCTEEAQHRKHARRREIAYATLTSRNRKALWAAVAFVALLVFAFLGMAQAPVPRFYPILTFAGLIASGATGALVRSVFWGTEETTSFVSLVVGGVAGFVVGLAYLIPQFVGAPEVLSPEAEVVSATDKIQFISALLVAISAGVGFDTVFARLKSQAEKQPISPSS